LAFSSLYFFPSPGRNIHFDKPQILVAELFLFGCLFLPIGLSPLDRWRIAIMDGVIALIGHPLATGHVS